MSSGSAFTGFTPSPDPFLEDDDDQFPPEGDDPSLVGSEGTNATNVAIEAADARPFITLAEDKCRFIFFAKSYSRVCGKVATDCQRTDHRSVNGTRSPPGNYRGIEPVRKGSPYDGDPGTWCRPIEEQRAANFQAYATMATPQASGGRKQQDDPDDGSLIGSGVVYQTGGVLGVSGGQVEYGRLAGSGSQSPTVGFQMGTPVPSRTCILKKSSSAYSTGPPATTMRRSGSPTVSQSWTEQVLARQAEVFRGLQATMQEEHLRAQAVQADTMRRLVESIQTQSSGSHGPPPAAPPSFVPTSGVPSVLAPSSVVPPAVSPWVGASGRAPAEVNLVSAMQLSSVNAGRDESTGESKVFEVNLEVPTAVLTTITPHGISDDMRRQFSELMLDAVSLPGKFTSCDDQNGGGDGSAGELLGELATAIQAMTNGSVLEGGRGIGDTGWKSNTRTACVSIRSYKILFETERTVRSMERMLFRALEGSCRQVLAPLGWSEETMQYFLHNSRFCNLNRAMYSDYLGFLTELLRMYTMFSSFVPVKKALDWYIMRFKMNRSTATSRTLVILRNYVDLREARRASYPLPMLTVV
jgi:hypothetical protein